MNAMTSRHRDDGLVSRTERAGAEVSGEAGELVAELHDPVLARFKEESLWGFAE
jgi:hypothetical protein